jgi:hypothetical protein
MYGNVTTRPHVQLLKLKKKNPCVIQRRRTWRRKRRRRKPESVVQQNKGITATMSVREFPERIN